MGWRLPDKPLDALRVVSWCVEGTDDVEHHLRKYDADVYMLQRHTGKDYWCPSYFCT